MFLLIFKVTWNKVYVIVQLKREGNIVCTQYIVAHEASLKQRLLKIQKHVPLV